MELSAGPPRLALQLRFAHIRRFRRRGRVESDGPELSWTSDNPLHYTNPESRHLVVDHGSRGEESRGQLVLGPDDASPWRVRPAREKSGRHAGRGLHNLELNKAANTLKVPFVSRERTAGFSARERAERYSRTH